MTQKKYAVGIFHYPTSTHEIHFNKSSNEVTALNLALTDFIDSFQEDEILTKKELEKIFSSDTKIHALIDQLTEHNLHCLVEEIKE